MAAWLHGAWAPGRRSPASNLTKVKPSADWYYSEHGWKEGRDPSAWFDTSAYLATHPDLAASGVNPLGHCCKADRRLS